MPLYHKKCKHAGMVAFYVEVGFPKNVYTTSMAFPTLGKGQ